MGISLYSESPLYLSLVIVLFKEFLTFANRLQKAELLLPHYLSTLTTSLSSASCLLPSISGDSLVPKSRLQLHHHFLHRLWPEMDSWQKYLWKYQPYCGQYLFQLFIPSWCTPADFYFILWRQSGYLQRTIPMGQQIFRWSRVHPYRNHPLLLWKWHVHQLHHLYIWSSFLMARLWPNNWLFWAKGSSNAATAQPYRPKLSCNTADYRRWYLWKQYCQCCSDIPAYIWSFANRNCRLPYLV